LIKEGGLLAPWVTELRTACEKSRANLQNRELVIDLKNLTAISQEGENVLLTKGANSAAARLPNTSCGNWPAENKKP
jgi:hypothetical protein